MKLSQVFLKAANFILSFVVVLSLLVVGAYSFYALWDNQQIYASADDVQADMLKIKPDLADDSAADAGATFAELLAINPDICAWLTVDNTKIDYPVVQGKNNLSYINTDVYGNFALAGSIYLDSRNDKDFQDSYSLLYGHYMADERMFGGLGRYKDKNFFNDNRTGTLMLPNRTYKLEIFASLMTMSTDEQLFETLNGETNINKLLSYTEKTAMYLNEDTMERLKQTDGAQVLALSTCTSEYTDARIILLAAMIPYAAAA